MESPRTLVQRQSQRGNSEVETRRRRISDAARAPSAGQWPEGGDVLLGRYRLDERLGAGGFGVVWRAHDELLHRDVAVKRIWLGPDGDSERATREALASARLAHPAIVALYEACTVDDAFYLISELVDGDTLAQLIADNALEDEQLLEIGLALTGALVHAHARGVIHRDIKPQNVLVPGLAAEARAAAKLTDFGGASLAGEEALTQTGDVLGTLAYMSPEQTEGRAVGEFSDVYSLALVLYEGLCGVNPVRGPTPAATARRIGRRVEPLERSRRDLPRELTRTIDGALLASPRARVPLEELAASLQDTLQAGLGRSRWGRVRPREPGRPERRPQPRLGDLPPATPEQVHVEAPLAEDEEQWLGQARPPAPARVPRAPRVVWIAASLLLVGWEVSASRAGVGLLALAALLPLLAVSGRHGSSQLGLGRLAAVLAPVLGLAGLAGAFPALAGQASRWSERALLGALGYWWLTLSEPLLSRRLWIGPHAGTPPHAPWQGSVSASASHVLGPLLSVGVLLGALLWGAAAMALPLLVRGRSAVIDTIAAAIWSAALIAAAPALDSGLTGGAHPASPRGAVLGAVLGAAIAVAARALRGPV